MLISRFYCNYLFSFNLVEMHPAWHNDDIRYLVFELLEPQDLSRLAQTCKTFFDFTIDELWKTVTSFSAFVSCLPPNFRQRPLRADNLQRLDFYASKVQNLVLESKNIKTVIRLPPPFKSEKQQKRAVTENLGKNSGMKWENCDPRQNFYRISAAFALAIYSKSSSSH